MKTKDIKIIMLALKNAIHCLDVANKMGRLDDLFVDLDMDVMIKGLKEEHKRQDSNLLFHVNTSLDFDKLRALQSYLYDDESVVINVPTNDDIYNFAKCSVTNESVTFDLKKYTYFGGKVDNTLDLVYKKYHERTWGKKGKKTTSNKCFGKFTEIN